ALFHVPAPVMIKKESGDFVGRGMSFFMIGGELARTLGPLTVIGAVSVWGFSGIWRLIFPGIAASVFLFFRIRSIPISREVKNIQPTATPLENARKFSGFFLTIFMFLLCQSSMKSALVAYLPTYLNTEGQSLWSGGISLSIFQTSGVFGTLLAGNISDLIGRKKTLLFSSVAAPIFMLLFLTVPSLFSMFFLVLTGITLFASGPVLLAFVQDKAADSPSFFNGIHMTVTFITGAITIFLVGFISDITSMEHAFFFSAGIAAFSVLFVWRLPSK
ncbi:MAG: MFS transporter, partial [bacterium]